MAQSLLVRTLSRWQPIGSPGTTSVNSCAILAGMAPVLYRTGVGRMPCGRPATAIAMNLQKCKPTVRAAHPGVSRQWISNGEV